MSTRPDRFLRALPLAIVVAAGCTAQPEALPPPPAPPYTTTATVKDIMQLIVDPAADEVWQAVMTVHSAQGTVETVPRSDEDWLKARRGAMTLIEASNLLMTPGRHVAKPGQQAKNPRVQLDPIEIESLIEKERASWTKMSRDLQDSMQPMLKAIDAKNPTALSDSSIAIDEACEACHHKFWYPDKH